MSWVIAVLVLATVLGFVVYLVGLASLPTVRRPRVPTYDRFGCSLGDHENPGARIAPGRGGDRLEERMKNERREEKDEG